MFKFIVNGGSFALIVLFFVWLLFSGEPKYRAMMIAISANHEAAISKVISNAADGAAKMHEAMAKMQETFTGALRDQQRSHESEVAKMQDEFRTALDAQEKQCRSERKEWLEAIREEAAMNRETIRTEGEANRKARHEAIQEMNRLYTETWIAMYGQTPHGAPSQPVQNPRPPTMRRQPQPDGQTPPG